MTGQKHFSYDELDAFLHGDLPLLKRVLCQLHLRGCEQCRGMLQHVKEDNELLENGVMKRFEAARKDEDGKA